jgi:ammonium transporter, Amt family
MPFNVYDFFNTTLVGFVSGLLYYGSSLLLVFLEVDDVTDSIPVHGVNGVWGLIAAGLFASQENYSHAYFTK